MRYRNLIGALAAVALVATGAVSPAVAADAAGGAATGAGTTGASTATAATAATTPNVGIWYATWYSKVPALPITSATGHGASSASQFLADVNADGKDDAVTFDATGAWRVGLSTGTGFAAPSTWVSGHGVGSSERFMADVNGDGRSDAIAYFAADGNGDGQPGDWYVALSSGTSFQQYTLWRANAGAGANARFVADVTGDGRADLATFTNGSGAVNSGTWHVGASSGTGFAAPTTWRTGFGGNTTRQFLADTTGDGKADAVYFAAWDGSWYTTPSTGTSFGTAAAWTTTHGIGSNDQFVTDGNGDGYAEPYVYFHADVTGDGVGGDLIGREYDRALKAISPENIALHTGFGVGATRLLQGNISGDRYGWKATVAFTAGVGGGTWNALRYRSADSVSTNTWAGFPGKPAIRYVPLTLGSYQTYDSGNSAVIDEHLNTISGAEIDWLLLDETNGLNNVSGAILNRAADVAARIAVHNAQPSKRDIRYAFAIGRVQWTGTPVTIEQEAAQTWAEFAGDPTIGGPEHYHEVDGKPLLVVYAPVSTQNAWRSYTGDKSASNHFTVRFASTALPGEYGWQLGPDGSPSNDEVMLTMPGWNNNVPGYTPVSRQNGLYYIEKTWRRVLDRPTPPESVVINSFNEFAEETSVQIADTNGLVAPAEKWINTDGVVDNSMYWNMTKDFVRQLKHPDAVHHAKSDFASTQGAGGWSYEQWTYPSGSRVITPMTWDSANTRWKGTTTWTMVRSDAQHPDVGADAARVYVAPAAGSTVVTGVVSKPQAGGDGVVVRILKNGTQIWPTGTTGTTLTTAAARTFRVPVTVAVGDRLEFVTQARSTAAYDTTAWDATVTYQ